MNALADRYVLAYRENFPLFYAAAGLPNPVRDRLNINSPADLERWLVLNEELDQHAARIDARTLRGKPEAITLAILRQAVNVERARALCREELWHLSADDWLLGFLQVAELQGVANEAERTAVLARYGGIPKFLEQETHNLRTGLRRGYSASRTAVDWKLAALDRILSEPIDESALMSPAHRADSSQFAQEWRALIVGEVIPALRRHRDFLRSEYRAQARTHPSIAANPGGAACYRATVSALTTVDLDPQTIYEEGVKRVENEVNRALEIGKRRYGRTFKTLAELHNELSEDPANRFANEQALTRLIQDTLARTKGRSTRVVPDPPGEDVIIKPFPSADAPSGQYIPADAEGMHDAIYYYRADFQNLTPAALEATVLHEVWPGHHLQFLVSKAHTDRDGHPIAQLVFLPGVGEGWATYTESLGLELGLYGSDLAAIGSAMDSMSPRMVADLGIHVRGWSEEQAFQYLIAAIPALPPERLKSTLAGIVSSPGTSVPYAAGALQIEALRAKTQRAMGKKFDLRRFHQLVIEDGTAPFPVIAQKLELWAKR